MFSLCGRLLASIITSHHNTSALTTANCLLATGASDGASIHGLSYDKAGAGSTMVRDSN
jgi:hypothetical protein